MTLELGVYTFGNTPRTPDGRPGPTAQAVRDALEAVKLADEVGLPMFLGIPGGTSEYWAQYGHAYRHTWARAGHPAGQADIAVAVHGFVGGPAGASPHSRASSERPVT